MEELEEYEVEERQEPFRIENDEQAAWAMRQLKGIVDRQLANQAIADKEIERCEQWVRKVNSSLQNRVDYFRGLLTEYMRQERAKNRKSISLPHGMIRSKAVPAKVEPDDEFVQWAETNAKHLLRYKPAPPPEPNMSEINQRLKKGEQIEHLIVSDVGVSFVVEVAK